MSKIKCMPTRIGTSTTSRMSGVRPESQPRKSAALRGYGYKWRVARIEFLRSNPLCVMCYERGHIVAATVVDHKIPHRGNMILFWDRNNWQGLCATDHSSHKQAQERADGHY